MRLKLSLLRHVPNPEHAPIQGIGMSFDVVLADLKNIHQAESSRSYSLRTHLTEVDIQRWSTLIGEPRGVLYDRIAFFWRAAYTRPSIAQIVAGHSL